MDHNILVISSQSTKASEGFKKKLVSLLYDSNFNIFLFGGVLDEQFYSERVEKICRYEYNPDRWSVRLIGYIITQIKAARMVFKTNPDIYIFFLSQTMIFPMIVAKLKKKRSPIMIFPGGSTSNYYWQERSILFPLFFFLERIGFLLADKIILYSNRLIKEWHIHKYVNKFIVAHEHYLDFNTFNDTIKFEERLPYIGYIGRFNQEKGILEFLTSLHDLMAADPTINVMIGGDGPQKNQVLGMVSDLIKQYGSRIEYVGWISSNELPDYLNKLKLLVIPSYTEGLPNIMLEAMACATPVAATGVGAIPEIIEHEKNGFLLSENDPATLKKEILEAMNNENLQQISANCADYVRKNFSYDRTLLIWRELMAEQLNK